MKAILLGGVAASLLTVSALGADLGVPPSLPSPPLAPFVAWTSCYGGLHGGGGFGTKDVTDTTGTLAPITGFTSVNLNIDGYVLGGQIGCDYQFTSNLVLGIEGAVSGGIIQNRVGVAQPGAIPGDNATFKAKTDFLTSVTGRVGYALDRWMPYVKGGAAWAGDKYSAVGTFGGVPYDLEALENRIGWTAGAGIEWAFWDDWSIKLEYDYYGFGSRNVTFIDSTTGNIGPESVKQSIQVVKLGVNLHAFSGP